MWASIQNLPRFIILVLASKNSHTHSSHRCFYFLNLFIMSVRYKLGDNVFKRILSFFMLFVFLQKTHPYIRFCDCLYSCISVFVIVCICICQEGKKLCAAAIFASFEGKLRRKLSRLNSPCLHIRHTSSPSHWLNSPWSLCLHIRHTSSSSSHTSKDDEQFNYQHQSTMH